MASPWDTFPANYREREIAQIAAWIDAGESGLVVGLSGAGKSNVLGFVAHRPLPLSSPQARGTKGEAPLRPLLDLNGLPEPTSTAFLRRLLAALDDAAMARLPAEAMERLRAMLDRGLAQTDAFLLGRGVEAALALVCDEMKICATILMDRFDVALERFDAPFFNNLRAWRDAHKTRLTYVVAARRDWPDWPNLPTLSEFTDLIAGRTCWVGALSPDDLRWNLERFAGKKPTKKIVEQMTELSGGHAGLLKALWAAQAARQDEGPDEWLKHSGVRRQCQELWDDLPALVQESLRAWHAGGVMPPSIQHFLVNAGLLVRDESQLRFTSSVLAAFAHEQAGASGGALRRDAATGQVYCGSTKLSVALTPQEDRLLAYLLAHPRQVCDKDALAEAIWPDEVRVEGVRDDRLAQLVRRLRDKVEPDPHSPRYIVPVWGRGYRLIPDGSED